MNKQEKYPKLCVNLKNMKKNTEIVVEECQKNGIRVTGVVKGFWGIPEIAKAVAAGGVAEVASSRTLQLRQIREAGITAPLMLIRIPMLSEAEEVIDVADISLQSDLSVLRKFNETAGKMGKKHSVILMADCGDLREGFFGKEEILRVAEEVEQNMPNLHLLGVGVNLGCYGSIVPTAAKLEELVEIAEDIEKAIGRKLDVVSGGSTTSFARLIEGNMPKGINHLRIGEHIITGRELKNWWGFETGDINGDIFILEAELAEVREKPTHPIGETFIDAFGNKPVYEDRGIRKRGILAVGKADYGLDYTALIPFDEDIKVIGASSDHTILDLGDAKKDYKVGDIVKFYMSYTGMLFLCNSPDVNICLQE